MTLEIYDYIVVGAGSARGLICGILPGGGSIPLRGLCGFLPSLGEGGAVYRRTPGSDASVLRLGGDDD